MIGYQTPRQIIIVEMRISAAIKTSTATGRHELSVDAGKPGQRSMNRKHNLSLHMCDALPMDEQSN
jgi:hypothetical protein